VNPTALHERLQAIAGNLTYRNLAELTKIHPETVRRYMQGQAPSVEFLAAVCVAMGVNGEWILTGRGPMRNSDVKSHALKEANAAELLSAVATTLEKLQDRVERLEVFVQTLEARVRGAARPGASDAELKPDGVQATAHQAPARIRAIADVVATRPRPDAR
jgi:transcriptional regulator with XRE-family HTH domain